MSPGSDSIKFKVIAAVCENMGIGIKGDIPWRLKQEMSYFQKMTTSTRNSAKKNAVVMGRKTWESIPPKYKPLAGRVNVVISNTVRYSGIHDVPICKSLEDAVALLTAPPYSDLVEDVWIIGGSALYLEAINSPLCEGIYLTRVAASFECDTFFPEIPSYYQEISNENVPSEVQEENGVKYRYTVLQRAC